MKYFIHIGKCGGGTLRNFFNEINYKCIYSHVYKPKISQEYEYIILIRNPITRLISSFNSRKILTAELDKRFKCEDKLLNKFNDIHDFVSDLDNFKGYIHHIHENISFYLTELLDKIQPIQIKRIYTQEYLNDELYEDFLKYPSINKHENISNLPKTLNETEYVKLKKYLTQDYECIEKLNEFGVLTPKQYEVLSK